MSRHHKSSADKTRPSYGQGLQQMEMWATEVEGCTVPALMVEETSRGGGLFRAASLNLRRGLASRMQALGTCLRGLGYPDLVGLHEVGKTPEDMVTYVGNTVQSGVVAAATTALGVTTTEGACGTTWAADPSGGRHEATPTCQHLRGDCKEQPPATRRCALHPPPTPTRPDPNGSRGADPRLPVGGPRRGPLETRQRVSDGELGSLAVGTATVGQ
eukprot:CAMPEP_0174341628 /NCGR_PEP_ID=MMETSP0810-20121108/25585_1 /TAXON_ID=73025 ORGANISM="Eutreptiella gymnastica-like, Strain CCMP1594" /NCGR_SAMPLE_ID=MMETSP0810 /ASSEMBLY_ACC=CAM_ASM_000659 /LENGTH=214 /DNA_ID=CAMNT_0015463421 /DNA_START=580 /DNA_END=1226 /DNA_ORIENTATION=-